MFKFKPSVLKDFKSSGRQKEVKVPQYEILTNEFFIKCMTRDLNCPWYLSFFCSINFQIESE